jgi:hypothetical protein
LTVLRNTNHQEANQRRILTRTQKFQWTRKKGSTFRNPKMTSTNNSPLPKCMEWMISTWRDTLDQSHLDLNPLIVEWIVVKINLGVIDLRILMVMVEITLILLKEIILTNLMLVWLLCTRRMILERVLTSWRSYSRKVIILTTSLTFPRQLQWFTSKPEIITNPRNIWILHLNCIRVRILESRAKMIFKP